MSKSQDPFERQRSSYKQYKNHVEKETRRKKIQSVNKSLKRGQRVKQTRRRDWLPDSEDWDDLDIETEERIVPVGEIERRRAVEKAAFRAPAPKPDHDEAVASAAPGQPGLVVEVSKGMCRVDVGERVLLCHIRGALNAENTGFTNPVAVGDRVIVNAVGPDEGIVEAILPRQSVLARPDVFHSHLQQAIVANADQLLIVASWQEPVIWLELVDRYLIAAERNHLPALICLNKIDLAEDMAQCRATLQPYQALGHGVVFTSALTRQGIAELRALLQNRTTVLAGLSGVGKSTLLSMVQPGLQLRTGAVSQSSGEGRHTTTQATLIRLKAGGAVVDTPGIREFGLSGIHRAELGQYFKEIGAVAVACRFKNCAHLTEPDCAVQSAVAGGKIAASRYHSYRQIYDSLLE